MYKYTYIQAADDRRITKRHKVRLLTTDGGTGERAPQRAPPGGDQAARRRAEHHAHHAHAPTHKRAYPRARAHAQGLVACCSARLVRLAGSLARYLPAIFNGAARLV